MKSKLYLIMPQTNLHVGNGDANYGIVDKCVQKDPKTGIPIINSSSLKGALREYFEEEIGWKSIDVTTGKNVISPEARHIFGGLAKDGDENSSNGKYRFFTSELLAIPVRCLEKQYFLATCPSILTAFVEKATKMGLGDIDFVKSCKAFSNLKDAQNLPIIILPETPITFSGSFTLEDFTSVNTSKPAEETLTATIGNDLAIFNDADFNDLVENLPVIARNHLENGISDNLWYEEIVPHHAVFYSFIGVNDGAEYFNDFSDELVENKLIQIGANASIGYGFCEFKLLS